jgi:hypothetical protein
MVVSTDRSRGLGLPPLHDRVADAQPPPRLPGVRRRRPLPAAGQTVSGGHGLRRYRAPNAPIRTRISGPFVQHEMNRCIHCYRCVRFYQEFAGYRDLGALQIATGSTSAASPTAPGKSLCRQPDRYLPHRRLHRQAVALPGAALGPSSAPPRSAFTAPGLPHGRQRALSPEVLRQEAGAARRSTAISSATAAATGSAMPIGPIAPARRG